MLRVMALASCCGSSMRTTRKRKHPKKRNYGQVGALEAGHTLMAAAGLGTASQVRSVAGRISQREQMASILILKMGSHEIFILPRLYSNALCPQKCENSNGQADSHHNVPSVQQQSDGHVLARACESQNRAVQHKQTSSCQ